MAIHHKVFSFGREDRSFLRSTSCIVYGLIIKFHSVCMHYILSVWSCLNFCFSLALFSIHAKLVWYYFNYSLNLNQFLKCFCKYLFSFYSNDIAIIAIWEYILAHISYVGVICNIFVAELYMYSVRLTVQLKI